MLNKLTGWLIFIQLGYVSLFTVLCVFNFATDGGVVSRLAIIRNCIGLSNRHISLSHYISYPLALSSPLNILLALVFFGSLLRRNNEIDFSKGFFNLINAFYVAASSWLFVTVFCSLFD